MPDLKDGESAQVQGSARTPYILKNVGGVYSCTCPAWRNQSVGIERRTCKHLRALRGEQAEQERLGSLPPAAATTAKGNADAAPKLLLAQSWENDTDLTGWWMSEKLDGVRAWWDRQALPLAAGQRLPCSRLVRRRAARRAAGRRTVAGSQGVPAHREHRPPPGQERPLAADPLRAVRRPRRQRSLRGAAEGPGGACAATSSAVCRRAGASVLHGRRGPEGGTGPGRILGRRGADAPAAGLPVRSWPLAHAAEGEDRSTTPKGWSWSTCPARAAMSGGSARWWWNCPTA